MEHRLVTERIVLVVTDNKPAISFQFKAATLPGNDAFDLMARTSSLVTGKGAAIAMRLLRQSCAAARQKNPGVATASANGISATCILPHDGGGVNFLVAAD
jgi:hypothetical protein